MVLGIAGLGGAWRAAHLAWGLPALVGEPLMLAAGLVWLAVTTLYGLKWLVARELALTEAAHPVQCCFIGLAGVATMLVAGGVIPYAYDVALALYVVGAAFTGGFAVCRTGGLWMGERDPSHTTPVLYLPTVADSFVAAMVGAALGFPRSRAVRLRRRLLRLARDRVRAAASAADGAGNGEYASADPWNPARPAGGRRSLPHRDCAAGSAAASHGMIGYGILQAVILLRLLPWILREPLAPSYWAFTFGVTALAAAPIRLLMLGDEGIARTPAPALFVFANVVVLIVAAGTLYRFFAGAGHASAATPASDRARVRPPD
ncbi:dicarboxylate transporter/tellurite-resistance protein TehA [Agrobacterium tumefaciens]|uniref:SLAC1 family transporter n=1 Tax=Agrobacterium tumefaciens TaxID=358 RepID=UPI0009CD2280|nr:dicarboxylate transporter/tellurite-resistance protein TehA [Agrobacterium tumefaciens]CUX70419.1 conserved membrane hypothetical protein [Agrobacterium sp. NCPPB 925]